MVKRLRRNPLKVESRVRFSYELLHLRNPLIFNGFSFLKNIAAISSKLADEPEFYFITLDNARDYLLKEMRKYIFKNENIEIALLTSSASVLERRSIINNLSNGKSVYSFYQS